jgi:hypothetical protein
MGFPVSTADGLEVVIVSKESNGETDILVDEQGVVYVAHSTIPGVVIPLDPSEVNTPGYPQKVADAPIEEPPAPDAEEATPEQIATDQAAVEEAKTSEDVPSLATDPLADAMGVDPEEDAAPADSASFDPAPENGMSDEGAPAPEAA